MSLLTGSIKETHGEEGLRYVLACSSLLILVILYTKLYKFMVIIPKCVMDGFMSGCVLAVFFEQLGIIFAIDIEYK